MGKAFKEALSGIIGALVMFILTVVYAKVNYVNAKADKSYVDSEILELKTLNESQHKRIEQKIDQTFPLILNKLDRIEQNQDKLMMER